MSGSAREGTVPCTAQHAVNAHGFHERKFLKIVKSARWAHASAATQKILQTSQVSSCASSMHMQVLWIMHCIAMRIHETIHQSPRKNASSQISPRQKGSVKISHAVCCNGQQQESTKVPQGTQDLPYYALGRGYYWTAPQIFCSCSP